MKTVAFYTLGCKLNFSETSTIARTLEEAGYQKVAFEDSPEVFIINTCSVTDNADKKCRKVIRDARRIAPQAFIAIIGCYAQLKPEEIAAIPGVDAVLGASEKFQLLELLNGFEKKDQAAVYATCIEEATRFNTSYSMNDRTRTFLKVQDGCDYSCTFCTIPQARGKSRSATIDVVVQSAGTIAADGVKEIVLTGVNTGDFGIRDGIKEDRFIDLIKALDQVEGINRFRISSIEPNLLNDEIIEFVAGSNRFVPHFHIPLQSGSDRILKQMKRRYLTGLYAERVARIKSLMPHCAIGVDVIVGFPGETEEDFLNTYHFLNDLDVSYLHVFTYSERAHTPAAEMENPVPQKVRQERSQMLRNLSEKKKRQFYEAHLGTTWNVLIEDDREYGLIHGFTENYIRVGIPGDITLVNSLQKITLGEINAQGIVVPVKRAEAISF